MGQRKLLKSWRSQRTAAEDAEKSKSLARETIRLVHSADVRHLVHEFPARRQGAAVGLDKIRPLNFVSQDIQRGCG